MLKILLLILVGLGIIVSVIVLYGAWHWQAGTEALISRLEAARSPIEPKTHDPKELAGHHPASRFCLGCRIRMAPAVTTHVHDAYIAGEGFLRAKLFGFWTVMEQPSTTELAHG